MAIMQRRRLPQAITRANRASVVALRKLRDYAPSNPAIQIEAVNAIDARLSEAEDAISAARQALEIALNAHASAALDLHEIMQEVKAAVIGQYGINSYAIQSLGRKRKIDYRKPARRRDDTPS